MKNGDDNTSYFKVINQQVLICNNLAILTSICILMGRQSGHEDSVQTSREGVIWRRTQLFLTFLSYMGESQKYFKETDAILTSSIQTEEA